MLKGVKKVIFLRASLWMKSAACDDQSKTTKDWWWEKKVLTKQPNSDTLSQCGDFFTTPVGVAHRALPVSCSHTHTAPAADPVAAAAAHWARVPKLSQRPLAAGAGTFAVLPAAALGTSPSQLLELQLHPPGITDVNNEQNRFSALMMKSLSGCHQICKNRYRRQ